MVAIAFAGTPDFAVPTLAALARADYEISAVLTQPDRPAGRGQMPRPSPVKREAEALGLTVHTPQRLDEARLLASLGPRPSVLVVVAYGLILPRFMLDWPGRGAVNVHASLLPRWRGAAPIQRVIEAGDALTGVSIMQMDEGLDTGPVFVHKTVSISDDETGGSLHDTLADLGAAALIEVLPGKSVRSIPGPAPRGRSPTVGDCASGGRECSAGRAR
jgi:methionyl-tRNA formyltransferase